MDEIIKIQEIEGEQRVDCQELYLSLGFDKSNWSKWYKKNITNNPFAIEETDYKLFVLSTKGRQTNNFIISIDFAKRICMMARTAKGEMIRRYFLEVERRYKKLLAEKNKQEIVRLAGIETRKVLTDTIQELIPDSAHKRFAYPNYTKLIYKTLFNKNIKQLREEFGISPKENLRECFNKEQLSNIECLESIVQGYIKLGMGYKEIKEILAVKKIND